MAESVHCAQGPSTSTLACSCRGARELLIDTPLDLNGAQTVTPDPYFLIPNL